MEWLHGGGCTGGRESSQRGQSTDNLKALLIQKPGDSQRVMVKTLHMYSCEENVYHSSHQFQWFLQLSFFLRLNEWDTYYFVTNNNHEVWFTKSAGWKDTYENISSSCKHFPALQAAILLLGHSQPPPGITLNVFSGDFKGVSELRIITLPNWNACHI